MNDLLISKQNWISFEININPRSITSKISNTIMACPLIFAGIWKNPD
jgi:hypothetical protein